MSNVFKMRVKDIVNNPKLEQRVRNLCSNFYVVGMVQVNHNCTIKVYVPDDCKGFIWHSPGKLANKLYKHMISFFGGSIISVMPLCKYLFDTLGPCCIRVDIRNVTNARFNLYKRFFINKDGVVIFDINWDVEGCSDYSDNENITIPEELF